MNGLETLKQWVMTEMIADAKSGDKVATYYMNGLDNNDEIVMAELAEYIARMFISLQK